MMQELYKIRSGEDEYISNFRQHHKNLEKLMELDNAENTEEIDKAWTAKNPNT